MSRKKRVYELAKELGTTGQDLAAKLRDLGFSEIKSHMTAMDEFLLLRVQGTLEAHGLVAESAKSSSEEAVLQSGGLTVRKKKKKKVSVLEDDEPTSDTESDETGAEPSDFEEAGAYEAEEVGPAEVEAPEEVLPTAAWTTTTPAPTAVDQEEAPEEGMRVESVPAAALEAEAVAEEAAASVAEKPAVDPAAAMARAGGTAPAPEAPALEPAPEAQAPEPAPKATPAPKPSPAPKPTAVRPETVTPAPARAPLERPAAATPKPAAAKAPVAKVEATTGDGIVRPSSKRRTGKVVGFVDLSKIQATPARKAESRRLRSKDDITPDVKPTLGHDRKRAFVRGDHAARGSLTAGQLREKESARFLRQRRPGAGGPGSGRTERGRGSRSRLDGTLSPHSGGEITLELPLTIRELAEGLSVKINQLMPKAAGLLGWGITNNTLLDEESAVLLAQEFGVELRLVQTVEAEEALLRDLGEKRSRVDEANLVRRPPVVAFLGHVDHGKTTLLDTIRDSRVTKGEAGGITQHIGAYQVQTKSKHLLTILDTPGHEAFTSMRARGAQATDIVVLVVAADDGVMPSTVEAINHVKAANEEAAKKGRDKTPVVVAINKMDKPEANPDKVRTELANRGLNPEEWGGDTAMVEISALKGTGIDDLLERVFLESEVLENLMAHSEGPAEGLVLEAEVQEGKGKVAYLLVQDGTLNQGDIILAGEGYGKVRSIHDDRGKTIQKAGPSSPVAVSGLNELPTVGEKFHVVEKLDRAKEVAEERSRKIRQQSLVERRAVTNETLTQQITADKREMINVVVKADVQGSLQAIVQQLENLKHEEVEVKVMHSALGAVTESDVDLVRSSGGTSLILAFNVGTASKARTAAERYNVEIRHYQVIYELLDELRLIMEGTLAPEFQEEITGHSEVRRVFKSSKFGNIAGCFVLDGTISRNHKCRVLRKGEVVHTGSLSSIRREKDEVKEIREGFECGMVVKDFPTIEEGDVIEAFKLVEVKRLLKI